MGFPGKFESSTVGRGNVSREIGRTIIYYNMLDYNMLTIIYAYTSYTYAYTII